MPNFIKSATTVSTGTIKRNNFLIAVDTSLEYGPNFTPGSKDTTFDIGSGFNSTARSIAIQTDGKILVGGDFITFTGSSQNYLIRLNSDGSKDSTFNIGSGFNSSIESIAIQSDGKILVGGFFTTFTGSPQNRAIRLNTDGSKDTSFNIGTGFNLNVRSIVIQSDGKILAGGDFTTFSGSSENRLIRLNTDGSKDTTFNIGTGFNIGSFGVMNISIQSDGKILAGGGYTTFTGSTQNKLIRLNTDGSKDTTFNIGTGFDGYLVEFELQTDGKIVAVGSFTTFTGSTQNRVIRLNTNGSKDTTFNIGTGFNSFNNSVGIQSDGKILVGGNYTTFSGIPQNRLIRLNIDGSKDTTFDIGSGFNATNQSIKFQTDGKILVGGDSTTFAGNSQNYLIRLNTDGTGFWSGIIPPTSGYTVYTQKQSQGPSIRVASTDSELITIANQYGGTSINTANDALNFFNSQSQYMVTNIDYENIVTNGLTFLLDAGFIPSYPKNGTSWSDLSGSGGSATLNNGPTFNSSNNGSIVFDGVDDYALTTNLANPSTNPNESVFLWFYPTLAGQIVSELGQAIINTSWHDSNIELSSGGIFSFSIWHGSLTNKVVSTARSFNTWYNIGFTYTGTTLTAYINGASIGTTTFTRQTNTSLYYGLCAIDGTNMGTSAYGGGRMGNFMFYNRALSSTEVLQNYNAQKSRYGL